MGKIVRKMWKTDQQQKKTTVYTLNIKLSLRQKFTCICSKTVAKL